MEVSDLPDEILVEILKWVPPTDLKMSLLVNKTWRKEGETPTLWKWTVVKVRDREDIQNLSIRRLERLRDIQIPKNDNWNTNDWEAFFQEADNLSYLKNIEGLHYNNLVCVEPELLARGLGKLEELDLSRQNWVTDEVEMELFADTDMEDRVSLTVEQAQALLEEICDKAVMKKLCLEGNNLSGIESGLFGRAMVGLMEVDLTGTSLTKDQLQQLFTLMCQDSPLKNLKLLSNDLSPLDPGLVGQAVSRLEEAYLDNAFLTEEQVQALFKQMSRSTRLKKLHLNGNDLSSVEPRLLAGTLCRLEEADVCYTFLTQDQLIALFTQMDRDTQLQLKKICLSGNNLSPIEPGLVGRVLVRLEEADLLNDTFFNDGQIESLFTQICQDDSKLKKLHFSDNIYDNLLFLKAGLFGRALSRLQEVNLVGAFLRRGQLEALFAQMCQATQLKKLILADADFAFLDSETFATAVTQLEYAQLIGCGINNAKAQAFFKAICSDRPLKSLDLGENDLSSVDPGDLATAVTKLKHVKLDHTRITSNQAEALFTAIRGGGELKMLDLEGNDLSSVDAEVLAAAVHELEIVCMKYCNLSTEQVERIKLYRNGRSKLKVLFCQENNVGAAVYADFDLD